MLAGFVRSRAAETQKISPPDLPISLQKNLEPVRVLWLLRSGTSKRRGKTSLRAGFELFFRFGGWWSARGRGRGALRQRRCLTRIDAFALGHQGQARGSSRGVQDIPVVSGWVFFDPLTEQIISFRQRAERDLDQDAERGSADRRVDARSRPKRA